MRNFIDDSDTTTAPRWVPVVARAFCVAVAMADRLSALLRIPSPGKREEPGLTERTTKLTTIPIYRIGIARNNSGPATRPTGGGLISGIADRCSSAVGSLNCAAMMVRLSLSSPGQTVAAP
jgi:hypothetical protein